MTLEMNRLVAIGRWSARHPRRVIAGWLAFVVLALAAGAATGTRPLPNGAVGESARGYALLDRHHAYPPERGYLLLRGGDRALRAAVADAAARLRATTKSPLTVQASRDHHASLITSRDAPALPAEALSRLQAAHPQVSIAQASDEAASSARDRAMGRDLHRAELLSLPVTLLVLLVAFGSVVAALVPMLIAVTTVAATLGLLGPISQAVALDGSVKTIVVLIGMAVGVDYALFFIVRAREERAGGSESAAALDRTARTSGRAVLISAATVAAAMAGMYLVGAPIFDGVATATIAVVACAAAASITVLPAVLAALGPRIDRGRIRRPTAHDAGRVWERVVACVLRRPAVSLVLSAALLVALALPALGLRLAKPSDEALASQREPALAALAAVRAEFPDSAAPALVAVGAPAADAAPVRRALQRLEALAVARSLAHPPFTLTSGTDRRGAVLELPLTGAGDNAASRRAIVVLRGELVPRTLGRLPGVRTAVTGDAAEDVDFTHQIRHGIARVFAFVLVLAFGLLLVAFRSIVVPLKAIALDLLSVAAAYGVLVLVFQGSWAQPVLGFHGDGAIIAWLPLFLFVVLFGLSMDYHVFILSRVREAVDAGMSTEAAVRHAILRTARVVTSAALVMVGVFSLFACLSSLELKQAGVGLAASVLIDATVVRAVLLPAAMTLLGERNWYLPRALRRVAAKPAGVTS